MNFFDHQRAAKGITLKLVFLFVVAVVAMVASIDAVAALVMMCKGADVSMILVVVIGVTAVTLLIIAGGMITKTVALRRGRFRRCHLGRRHPGRPTSTDPNCAAWSTLSRRCHWLPGSRCPACSFFRRIPESTPSQPVSLLPTRRSR